MTSVCGLLYTLLSGQPLVIIGVTGPMLVFEESLYQVKSPRTALGDFRSNLMTDRYE